MEIQEILETLEIEGSRIHTDTYTDGTKDVTITAPLTNKIMNNVINEYNGQLVFTTNSVAGFELMLDNYPSPNTFFHVNLVSPEHEWFKDAKETVYASGLSG